MGGEKSSAFSRPNKVNQKDIYNSLYSKTRELTDSEAGLSRRKGLR